MSATHKAGKVSTPPVTSEVMGLLRETWDLIHQMNVENQTPQWTENKRRLYGRYWMMRNHPRGG